MLHLHRVILKFFLPCRINVFNQQGPELEVHLVIPGHVVDVSQDGVEDNLLVAEIGETAENKVPTLGYSKAVRDHLGAREAGLEDL